MVNTVSKHRKENTLVLKRDATRIGTLPNGCFKANIAFLDPPYEQGLVSKALESLIYNKWLKRHALCVIEMSAKETFNCPIDFEQLDARKYGRTIIYLIKFRK